MRWLGTLGVLVLLLLLGGGVYVLRMARQGFSTRTEPGKAEAVLATGMRTMAVPARYKSLVNPANMTPETIHAGLEHYADHCAVCHGNDGHGDTMMGRMMYPRPPNLAGPQTQAETDGELYYPIQYGIRMSGMPAFGEPRDDDADTWKLVVFLRHLPKLTTAEMAEMEHLNPKGPEEWQEEKDEEQFLAGSAPSATTATPHHPKGLFR